MTLHDFIISKENMDTVKSELNAILAMKQLDDFDVGAGRVVIKYYEGDTIEHVTIMASGIGIMGEVDISGEETFIIGSSFIFNSGAEHLIEEVNIRPVYSINNKIGTYTVVITVRRD